MSNTKHQLTVATSTTPAYNSGDNIGGLMSIVNYAFQSPSTHKLNSVKLTDFSRVQGDIDLILFERNPSNTTLTDNAAQTIHLADVHKILSRIAIQTSDYLIRNNHSVAQKSVDIPITLMSGNQNLYIALESRHGQTYSSTQALALDLGFSDT
jgi:hypothetical protein